MRVGGTRSAGAVARKTAEKAGKSGNCGDLWITHTPKRCTQSPLQKSPVSLRFRRLGPAAHISRMRIFALFGRRRRRPAKACPNTRDRRTAGESKTWKVSASGQLWRWVFSELAGCVPWGLPTVGAGDERGRSSAGAGRAEPLKLLFQGASSPPKPSQATFVVFLPASVVFSSDLWRTTQPLRAVFPLACVHSAPFPRRYGCAAW